MARMNSLGVSGPFIKFTRFEYYNSKLDGIKCNISFSICSESRFVYVC